MNSRSSRSLFGATLIVVAHKDESLRGDEHEVYSDSAADSASSEVATSASSESEEGAAGEDLQVRLVLLQVVRKAPPRTYVIQENMVFVTMDNVNEPDLVVRMRKRWTTERHLGSRPQSRSLQPVRLGETRNHAPGTLAALKAWSLWRLRQKPEWLQARSARRGLYRDLVNELRHELSGLTLTAPCRKLIQEWAPDALR